MKKCLGVSFAALIIGIGLGWSLPKETAQTDVAAPQPTEMAEADESLGRWIFAPRKIADVSSFYMDTPGRAYHFNREASGAVRLDGEKADAEGFVRMLELFFDLPVHERAHGDAPVPESMSFTLGYDDGTDSTFTIGIDEADAWVCREDGSRLRTDAWRIQAVIIACDGARLDK